MDRSFIDTLHDPAVRDLAWVISSPGLPDDAHPPYHQRVVADAWCNAMLEASISWLASLDCDPQPLHEFIAAHPTRRLGLYFEVLIRYWLLHMADTQMIASNLQVQSEQRTLGEYDFLFREANGAVCHWEAAVKFYLQVQAVPEQRSFIGPGTRDRLDLKLERVFQHQLLLGNSAAGQQALPPGIALHKALAFIKGYLFYHASIFNREKIPGISTAHLTGWWTRHALETIPQTSADNRWVILPRMRWLSPARLAQDTQVMNREELDRMLNAHFQLHQDALLLCEMQRIDDGWMEISRGFVVCPAWPKISIQAIQ